jgi:tetratricopeptide (TPR) repeat protein
MISTQSIVNATRLAQRGDLLSAIAALDGVWLGVGVEPARDGETDREFAGILLACGILTIEVGRLESIPFQAAAKDLLSKSCRLFGSDPQSFEAQLWLANAYLWSGENREVVALTDSILRADAPSEIVFSAGNLKGLACLNLGDLAASERSFSSVDVLMETAPAVSRGKFYLNRGMLYRQTGRFDAAVADYEAAHAAFADAGNLRLRAAAQNNLAGAYTEMGRYSDAHVAAQSALLLFELLGDLSHEAKVWDQIAQIFVREDEFDEAARCSVRAVEILSTGDHEGWLAEALITHGIALSRASMKQAHESLRRALMICERQGDPKQAELATAAMWEIVKRSEALQEELRRTALPVERDVYERVLAAHAGRITPAAHELGYNHQALQWRLENYFPELLSERRPRRRRATRILEMK